MADAVVRTPQDDDIVALTAIYNHYIVATPITFDLEPLTVEERRRTWFDHYATSGRHRLLVLEKDRDVIGYCSSSTFRPKGAYQTSVEASVYLAPMQVGRGYGAQLYTALFEELRKEDVHRAYAGITLPNDASVALHKRFGFTSVGVYNQVGYKLDKYWDVEWFEKRLRGA
ncbi:MAG TPA: GNAT family N-acetyltransferase [Candidatus Acidoferrales bacterium]|nr:GNAT family N-acetyltransferase [Candidatus Acidoferrales bacterium]